MNSNQNPQRIALTLINVAATKEIMNFISNAIYVYFTRVIRASQSKLVRYGLRPVITPVAAEEALQRVQYVAFSAPWLHALITNDMDVATLAWRAVRFYAKRYADMDLADLSDEVGEVAMTLKDTARLLNFALDAGSHQPERHQSLNLKEYHNEPRSASIGQRPATRTHHRTIHLPACNEHARVEHLGAPTR